MRAWFKEQRRQLGVWWRLRMARAYPETLPNPSWHRMTAADRKRVDGLKSVCLFLGPYRNLTTLTGSLLALHPECQVLDHASPRVFGVERIDFLESIKSDTLHEFCHFAITMSQGGTRGKYGGSMLVSHAFADNPALREVYLKRFGARLLKRNIKGLVWKEPQRVTQRVRQENFPFVEMLEIYPKLRFLLPIRNPLDTASSITRMGGSRWYGDLIQGDKNKALSLVLDDIRWFFYWQQKYPKRFFHFYQDELNRDMLVRFADFLGISRDEQWVGDTLSVYKVRAHYEYDPETLEHYAHEIQQVFKDRPDVVEHLAEIVKNE